MRSQDFGISGARILRFLSRTSVAAAPVLKGIEARQKVAKLLFVLFHLFLAGFRLFLVRFQALVMKA